MTSPSPSPLAGEELRAIQHGLAAEHAAEWAYGLASAFLPGALDPAVREGLTAHRARRDATIRLIRDAGGQPIPAEPSYLPATPVKDQASALTLLITAETDTSAAWRAVLERTDGAELRKTALDALSSSAVRATRWRKIAGLNPLTVAFPGQP